jgi:hypothetical protein
MEPGDKDGNNVPLKIPQSWLFLLRASSALEKTLLGLTQPWINFEF